MLYKIHSFKNAKTEMKKMIGFIIFDSKREGKYFKHY
jgi:hypothetical protein